MSTPPPLVPDFLAALARLGKKYVHISFYFPPPLSELMATHYIQPVINSADDWLKYADNCWIVWSSNTAQQWYEKFAGIEELKPCSVFIINVDLSPSNRAGQFPKWVWDWFNKTR